MKQREINPWTWQEQLGYSQAIEVEGASKMLFISGQTAIDDQGRPAHVGDPEGQVKMSLDHLETVLGQADLSMKNLVRIVVYTTDVDELFPYWGLITERVKAAGGHVTATVVGITRLAFPELKVEIEATAVS